MPASVCENLTSCLVTRPWVRRRHIFNELAFISRRISLMTSPGESPYCWRIASKLVRSCSPWMICSSKVVPKSFPASVSLSVTLMSYWLGLVFSDGCVKRRLERVTTRVNKRSIVFPKSLTSLRMMRRTIRFHCLVPTLPSTDVDCLRIRKGMQMGYQVFNFVRFSYPQSHFHRISFTFRKDSLEASDNERHLTWS